ncbi:unnamed protein product [Rhodiola kirilowii]
MAAAVAMTVALPQFSGLKAAPAPPIHTLVSVRPAAIKRKGALGARCDFIGSPTNLVLLSICLESLAADALL